MVICTVNNKDHEVLVVKFWNLLRTTSTSLHMDCLVKKQNKTKSSFPPFPPTRVNKDVIEDHKLHNRNSSVLYTVSKERWSISPSQYRIIKFCFCREAVCSQSSPYATDPQRQTYPPQSKSHNEVKISCFVGLELCFWNTPRHLACPSLPIYMFSFLLTCSWGLHFGSHLEDALVKPPSFLLPNI